MTINVGTYSRAGTMVISPIELATLLREAAQAHHEYELSLGQPDPNWPEWYARWISERKGRE